MAVYTGYSKTSEMTTGNRRIGTRTHSRSSARMQVVVLDEAGKPINPCHHARARKLIKKNRAKLVSRSPYTIQMLTSPKTLGKVGHEASV